MNTTEQWVDDIWRPIEAVIERSEPRILETYSPALWDRAKTFVRDLTWYLWRQDQAILAPPLEFRGGPGSILVRWVVKPRNREFLVAITSGTNAIGEYHGRSLVYDNTEPIAGIFPLAHFDGVPFRDWVTLTPSQPSPDLPDEVTSSLPAPRPSG